ncbi:hypothetical protein [Brevundimonas vesicularis]|uniref:hypothetical protein n=1 Tax=Brevundimonas vesicularis TaxID=41276 RepID=UPI0038D42BAB
MADLSATQRIALAELLARCSTPMLTQVDAMAAGMSGQRARVLRQLAAKEARNRERRDLVLGPLDPLFAPRADGLPGLSFPAAVRGRLWVTAIGHEPGLLGQLDRGDQVSRTVADRLCLSAAMDLRDHPDRVWPGANRAEIESLAACLDLIGVLRRHLGHMEDWLRGGTAEATAALTYAMKQAATISPEGPRRLLEILFAHTREARLFLRLLGQVMPLVGREPHVTEEDISLFTARLVEAVQARARAIMDFDCLSPEGDLRALRAHLAWSSEILAEFDASTLMRADATAGSALRQVRQDVSRFLSDLYMDAEQTVLALLPIESSVLAGRMKRPVPRLDMPADEAVVAKARVLLAVVSMSRGPALVFGRESDRRQTAEGLTWRLASWADEAIERVNEGLLADENLACRRIAMTADLLALIDAREAARSIRRRLMASGVKREHLRPATTGASPRFA